MIEYIFLFLWTNESIFDNNMEEYIAFVYVRMTYHMKLTLMMSISVRNNNLKHDVVIPI